MSATDKLAIHDINHTVKSHGGMIRRLITASPVLRYVINWQRKVTRLYNQFDIKKSI